MPAPHFDAYLKALRTFSLGEKTEHTDRAALEALLRQFAEAAVPGAKGAKITVQHEPPKAQGLGAPDYRIGRAGMILGYVEAKTIDEDLGKVLKSDQIKRYKQLSDNLILTDYLRFIWITPDKPPQEARLAHASDLTGKTLHVDPHKAAETQKLLEAFFSTAPAGIGTAQGLALALATRSQLLRDFLGAELVRQQKEHTEGKLYALFDVFRTQVFHELTLADFADAFAQMLAYGLFLARLNAGEDETITLENVRKHVPTSFRLIRELVDFLKELDEPEYRNIRWVVGEVLSIVNGLKLDAIRASLSFRNRKAISRKIRAGDEEEHRLFERDPFIYFYEDFLRAYDKDMRKGRGVYYTPPPVVNFIVRAIDDILKETFGIKDGLADHNRVTVLDFATGTGTFLVEVLEQIFKNIGGPDSGKANQIVPKHVLKNIYGFEYLIAPYTIAHLKLSQYLKDQGHPLEGEQRVQVYLTNTLEPIEPQQNMLLPAISAEVKAAQEVKDKPILVITGNPPYSGHSKNKGAWITASIAAYRDGFPELSKPAQGKWLQDDYVKFIRFAQMKMDDADEGVVGIITNHSWLDNPTFKGMRKSLLETFDQLWVLDLHGNAKKKERAPDGDKDENVFDIEQGVAISLFVKRPDAERGVWHGDLWGDRLSKYRRLAESDAETYCFVQLEPQAPDWLLRPQDDAAASSYRRLWSLRDVFSDSGEPAPGIVTTHDEFAISFTPAEAQQKVRDLLATDSEGEARKLFRLCSQSQWSYSRAKTELTGLRLPAATQALAYRPFDDRFTIWNSNVAVHRRLRSTEHLRKKNIGLVTTRVTKDDASVLVVDKPAAHKIATNYDISYAVPIWLYEDGKRENLATDFRAFLDDRYDYHYEPEEVLGYLYAVLHAPTYRSRYADFLRTDFPRIPFAGTRDQFDALEALGSELVQAHLLREVPERGLAKYHGKGTDEVEFVRYSESDQTVAINGRNTFSPVRPEVWAFRIGGYQVLDKYLKSRKGRTLSLDEIDHVAKVADTLAFTIEQMEKIDAAYLAAFPQADAGGDAGPH